MSKAMRAFPSRLNKRQSTRAALTILEVLVSIGLLTLGLLGVVVLLPIASQKINKGMALDDATALGRAGIADFEARGANNFKRWIRYVPNPAGPPPMANSGAMNGLMGVHFNTTSPNASFVNPNWSFCIDPMMYENDIVIDGSNRDISFFPYNTIGTATVATPPVSTAFGRMVRVGMNWTALDWSTLPGPASLNVGLASSMCESKDDLLLNTPGQEPVEGLFSMNVIDSDRPASQFDETMQSWDDATATRVKRNAQKRTSWFATMTPLPGAIAGSGIDAPGYYTLSIAVVDRRDMTIDSTRSTFLDSTSETAQSVEAERTAGLRFVGGGQGGGDVQLVSYAAPEPLGSDPNDEMANTLLAKKSLAQIREGNWILVSGPSPASTSGHIYNWYRIGTIDAEPSRNPLNPNEIVRNATLRGPDWPGTAYPSTGMAEAIIVSNVINVIEKTIELRGE